MKRDVLCAIFAKKTRYRGKSLRTMPGVFRFAVCILFYVIVLTAAGRTQVLTVTRPHQNRQSVNVGARVVFIVEATSTSGQVDYRWQYSKAGAQFADLHNGDFNGRVSGANSDTLTIDNAQSDDDPVDPTRVRCLVSDPQAPNQTRNSGPGFLTVSTNLPFHITVPTGPLSVNQKQTAIFDVEISGQSGILSGNWQFRSDQNGGQFVGLGDGTQASGSVVHGSGTTILQIDNLQPQDTGKYRYIVSDTVGSVVNSYNSKPTHLTVNPIANFKLEPPVPPSGSVTQGGPGVSTTITVDAINGFSGTVNLTTVPVRGITATFSQSSLSLPSSNASTLTLTADGTANTSLPPTTITIIGTDTAGNQDSTTFSLTVNPSPGGGSGPKITIQPMSSTVVVDADPKKPSGIVASAVFKVRPEGNAPPFTYQWYRRQDASSSWVLLPQDSSQCGNTSITLSPSIICGSQMPTLVIFNPQNLPENQGGDQGDYRCLVTDASAQSKASNSATLNFASRGNVDGGNPVPQLAELDSLIENAPEQVTDWQSMVSSSGIYPWTNGENKPVIGAVVGLWYGPRFIVQNLYARSAVKVDYRCWLQDFLNQQNGAANANNNVDSRNFQNREFGSFGYTGWVETAIAGVIHYANSPQGKLDFQIDPPSCQNFAFDLNQLGSSAQQYLRNAVGIYSLVAAADPVPALAEYIGVSGPQYTARDPDPNHPGQFIQVQVPNVPIPNTTPQQYRSPFDSTETGRTDTNFSVERANNPRHTPAIALAGQRTPPGEWQSDARAPILCLALGYTCDTTAEEIPQLVLLDKDHKNGNGILGPDVQQLFSGDSSSPQYAQKISMQHIIADNGTASDLYTVQTLLASVKVAQQIDLFGWKGGRASCMSSNGFNDERGVAMAVVYWQNGHFYSKGTELDFLYWYNFHGTTDGFNVCTVNTSMDPSNGKTRFEFDANYSYDPQKTPPRATIFLPDQDQLTFHIVLGSGGSTGAQGPSSRSADVTVNPPAGVYNAGQTVTLSSATSGATIYYTTDGSMPSRLSAVYSGPITLSTSGTIDAIATAPGLEDSSLISATYFLKTAAPTFNPPGGTYTGTQSVTLSDATPGATIYYTTDGSTPTTSSAVYSGPISVNSTTNISALATAPGFVNSNIANSVYTIGDFTISATPASQTVVACGNTSYTTSVSPINGFNGTVALGLSGVLMGGGTETFNPTSITGSGSSTLAVTTSSSTPAATYALSITGTGGGMNHYYTVNIVVQDFAISATPNSQTMVAGGNTTYSVSTAPGNGGFGFNTGFSVTGLPTGATATFSPASISGTGASTLTVSTLSSTPPGTYTLTVTAASGCLSHSGMITLVVNAYAAAPTISPAGGTFSAPQTVTLSTATPGAYIHYTTDGSYPTSASTLYGGPITVSSSMILNAITTATGYYNSNESGANFNFQAATPVISPVGGTYNAAQSVTITDASPGVAIHYTTDGSAPTVSSPLYSGPITVSSGATITAIATNTGWQNSTAVSATYTLQVATPVISPAGGTYSAAQSVTITDATPGAAIHYTMDGTTPTASSTVYSGPLSVSSTTTIRALATAAGFNNSGLAGSTYTYLNQPNDAQFVSQSVPTTMAAGQKYSVSVTMKNVGANTWNTTQYKLGAQNPQDNTTWGLGRVLLSAPVPNGSQVTFNFTVTAPTTASTYNFQWRMVQEGVQWFGGFSTNVAVQDITPQVSVSWVNGGTVRGTVSPIGFGNVQMAWRDAFLNGLWNTVAAQATPDANGIWYNTIPSFNPCHNYSVYANYAGVTSSTYTFLGGSAYTSACTETASISWIQTSYAVGLNPPNSLYVEGKASGAPAGTQVTIWWSDITAGTPWVQGGTSGDGTWLINIPNVTYSHQYSVYATYDAYTTTTCTYSGDGIGGTCP